MTYFTLSCVKKIKYQGSYLIQEFQLVSRNPIEGWDGGWEKEAQEERIYT